MPAAIAPALPAYSAPPAAAEGMVASSAEAAGTDFIGLLLGQLNLGGEPVSPEILASEESPEEAAAAAEMVVTDPTQLLATLGALPPSPKGETPTTAPGEAGWAEAKGAAIPGTNEVYKPTIEDTGEGEAGTARFAATELAPSAFSLSDAKNVQSPGGALAAPGESAVSVELVTPGAPEPAAHLASSPANTAASAPKEVQLRVETPVRDPAWSNEVGQKIVWMASNEKQSAQLTLNPPQMGPIEISLNLGKDGASAYFATANPEVRQVLEAALPRLREMLAGVGVELGQASVGAESFQQQAGNEQSPREQASPWKNANAILAPTSGGAAPIQGSRLLGGLGRVDTFA